MKKILNLYQEDNSMTSTPGYLLLKYKFDPPTWEDISLNGENFEESILPSAFYSNVSDIPNNSSSKKAIKSNDIKDLREFEGKFQQDGIANWILIIMTIDIGIHKCDNVSNVNASSKILTPILIPPSIHEIEKWIILKGLHQEGENGKLYKLPVTESQMSDEIIPATPEQVLTSNHKCHISASFKTSTPSVHVKKKSIKRLSNIFAKNSSNIRKKKLKLIAMKKYHDELNLSGNSEKDLFHDSFEEEILDLTQSPTQKSINDDEESEQHQRKKFIKTLNSNFREIVFSPSPGRMSFSQNILGVTHNNTYGFRYASQNLAEANKINDYQYLTVMGMECFTKARSNYQPDPDFDQILAIFFTITLDYPEDECQLNKIKGAIVTSENATPSSFISLDMLVLWVENEMELIEELSAVIDKWDPDIFIGFEIQMQSWGYVLDRGTSLGIDLSQRLSRLPEHKGSHFQLDEYGFAHTHHIHITGRIILNLWRLLKSEVSVTSYTFQNVVYNILHQRIPEYRHDKLSKWWNVPLQRWRVIRYYEKRCEFSMMICERLDLLRRTSELARLFGIQFYEVLSRGTQLRVESMMLRLTRLSNMVSFSPSNQQRGSMAAPEWLALNMEPESKYYTDPVLVLDFQSLYPSVMIAHNYCFSTCLGKVSSLMGDDQPFKFGAGFLTVPPEDLIQMVDQLNISPCGVTFVSKSVREGILPKMLSEILSTRLMVKKAIKVHKDDPLLQRILHSRQLGLKLIANVTYGYTSANFSGRMPCVEVGDSVVSKGREILERAILLVNSNQSWGGRVVYGDTDSMFVHLPGASKERAFSIGREIARRVTEINPKPIKLKFEKVYLPCILQTKKRYVGYMYENLDQIEPVFDAKGIETVRRDGCPASSKLLEKALRILFDTSDVSLVKKYVQRQMLKLMQGKISLEDMIFAKEFRGFEGYRPSACVPSLELARQWCKSDRRKEPLIGERVPYVIIYGAPTLPLIKLVRSPHDLLLDSSIRINDQYYACKVLLPPLDRCFSLLSVDVFSWYSDLPKTPSYDLILECISRPQTESITRYFSVANCTVCGVQTTENKKNSVLALCKSCLVQPKHTVLNLIDQMRSLDRTVDDIGKICFSCMGTSVHEIDCLSLDCPITYRLSRAVLRRKLVPKLKQTISLFD